MGNYIGQQRLSYLWDKMKATFAKKSDVPSAGTSSPLMDGTAAAGSSTAFARADHVHPSDTARVPVFNCGSDLSEIIGAFHSVSDGTYLLKWTGYLRDILCRKEGDYIYPSNVENPSYLFEWDSSEQKYLANESLEEAPDFYNESGNHIFGLDPSALPISKSDILGLLADCGIITLEERYADYTPYYVLHINGGKNYVRYAVKDYDGSNGGEGEVNDGLPQGLTNLAYFYFEPVNDGAAIGPSFPALDESKVMCAYIVVPVENTYEDVNPFIDICFFEVKTTYYGGSFIPGMHSADYECTEYLLLSKKKRTVTYHTDSMEMEEGINLNFMEEQWVDHDYFGGGGGSGDVNVIETVKVNGTPLVPDANKAVNVAIPTAVSAFNNDAGYLTDESGITIYSGTGTPSNSLGVNGDIYIKTS